MFRFILLFVIGLAIVGWLTRTPGVRRGFWVALALLGTYAVLKATGVIEAIAPSRNGVF